VQHILEDGNMEVPSNVASEITHAVGLTVTETMVAAAESVYAASEGSLAWVFGNRMRAALEAALAEVPISKATELDQLMLMTLDTLSRHFSSAGQSSIADVLRHIQNRIATDVTTPSRLSEPGTNQ
jgi:hypothetical protein